jgi:hypothetical protein
MHRLCCGAQAELLALSQAWLADHHGNAVDNLHAMALALSDETEALCAEVLRGKPGESGADAVQVVSLLRRLDSRIQVLY